MHVSTNFVQEIRVKKSPGTNGLKGQYNNKPACLPLRSVLQPSQLLAVACVPMLTSPACLPARPAVLSCGAGEDIEERGALERRFRELCEREAALMAEMAALRDAAAV